MVLESILNPMQAEKKPWEMFFIGVLYSSIAVLLGLMIFGNEASLVIVFLTVLACVPIMYGAIKLEENKDMVINDERRLLKEHWKALSFFMYLFIGITFSLTLWNIFLPAQYSESAFRIQADTIDTINPDISGKFIEQENQFIPKKESNPPKTNYNNDVKANVKRISGNYSSYLSAFGQIFFNNIKVLIFCLLFAFLYGVGAVFILVWNASVLATAIGEVARKFISNIALSAGNVTMAHYFQALSLGVLSYSIHGLPEILSYFIGGLAGSIISIAVIRHDFRSKKFYHVLMDSTHLIAISVILLFIAATIEVFVTPAFF